MCNIEKETNNKKKVVIVSSVVGLVAMIILALGLGLGLGLKSKDDKISHYDLSNDYVKVSLDVDWANKKEKYSLTPIQTEDPTNPIVGIYSKYGTLKAYQESDMKLDTGGWIDLDLDGDEFYTDYLGKDGATSLNNNFYNQGELFTLNIDDATQTVTFSQEELPVPPTI